MLTRKQLQLLDFIKTRMDADGVPPSFDEMKEALDLRSKSGIHRLITALEERGFIRRLAHRARALEMLERVQIPQAALSEGVQTFLITDRATGEKLAHFTVITGVAMEDDLRAEVDLLRAELDMLKRAFRRHCLETAE